MRRRRRHGRVEHRRFIVTWQEARNVRDVLERLGLPESSRAYVMRRAARYRRMGVLLRKFRPEGAPKVDWDALRVLAERCRPYAAA